MKRKLPFFLTSLLILLVSILIGTGLMTLAYTVPISAMKDHLISSADTILAEGSYPNLYNWCTSELDNLTDGLMVSIAGYRSEAPAIVDAMEGCSYSIDDYASEFALRSHLTYGSLPFEKVSPYTRYWHGYLLFLKPLLALTDYSGIRVLNLILQTGLAAVVVALLCRYHMRKYILPFLLSVLIIGPHVIYRSLQFSTCYYTLLLGSIAALFLIGKKAGERSFYLLFLIIGIFTSFIDFLTYPISTFGVPAVFVLNASDNRSFRKQSGRVFKLFLFWLLGYIVMWLGKFPVACLVSDQPILGDAAQETFTWMVTARGFTNLFYMLYRNIRSFSLTPFMIPALIFAAVGIIAAIRRKSTSVSEVWKLAVPYLILAILPVGWYCVLAAPSYIHDFFTSKALVVSAFSILSFICRLSCSEKCIQNIT